MLAILWGFDCRTWATVLRAVLAWLPFGVVFLALMSSGLGHTAFADVAVTSG